ncbi:MAG: dihydrofolate reductase [Erysipelotrichaceae bacterium]|nr:dihydrofolate reductase [Erysipelotrichaceae bacterium]
MISFSVAFDPNKGIGIKGSLPWHIKEELKLFKSNTIYKTILMGQTTYEGLPRKLVDRTIMVVCNDPEYHPEGVEVIGDLISFLKEHQDDEKEYIVCGGASIYRQSYEYASKAYVSFIRNEYETDTKFDNFDLNDWNIDKEVEYEEFVYRELNRK